MLKNFFKFGKKKKGEEEQKSELENQLDKEIQESEDEIQKIKIQKILYHKKIYFLNIETHIFKIF